MSTTQRQGVITLIPKDNKSRQLLKNYRPISLLNTIYKMGSASIANRIKTVLDKLINGDQTGFITGRYMGENTRQVYDIMNYVEKNNIPGLLLLIDFEKAFDSISWKFIHKVLHYFQFGQSIRTWITLFYKNAELSVNQHCNLSPFFSIHRAAARAILYRHIYLFSVQKY